MVVMCKWKSHATGGVAAADSTVRSMQICLHNGITTTTTTTKREEKIPISRISTMSNERYKFVGMNIANSLVSASVWWEFNLMSVWEFYGICTGFCSSSSSSRFFSDMTSNNKKQNKTKNIFICAHRKEFIKVCMYVGTRIILFDDKSL